VRVALVGPFPFDPDRIDGGPDTSMLALLGGLAGLSDVEPQVITFVPGLAGPVERRVDGVPIAYLPAPRRLRSATLHVRERRSLTRALRRFGPDVVHAQDAYQYGFASLTATYPAPVVLTVHGIAREERRFATSWASRLRFGLVAVPLQRYCIRHARYLTYSTPYAAEYFASEIRGRTWDIPNPIPDRFFSAERSAVAGRILHAGKVVPLKRLLDLVEALPAIAAAVPDAHLRVVGGELDSAYGLLVQERIRELGLGGRVAFLGTVPPSEMVEEHRRASVFVLPSGQENSPLSIAEAMAVGVPVVATRVGGVPHLVEEGRTGYVVGPGDVSALAGRVAAILEDPALAAVLGDAARKRASRDFRADVVALRMRDLYDEALH
jgi:glycosyltransferase involved in cell wall biosynthesis